MTTSPVATEPAVESKPVYKDDDLVYVDPDTKTVVGLVEWSKTGVPLSKPYVSTVSATAKKGKEEKRSFWRKFYPWGTYRSMRRIYKIEGKIKDPEPNKTLEEILPMALNQAFWDSSNLSTPATSAPLQE